MRTILILFLLWALGLSSFLPVPVLVILCAALGSGAAATLWFARNHRPQPAKNVIERDTKADLGEKSR